ncbi:unnamed protein product [Paramecium sonneborni]|uniref:Protein kinase domain-containing protein n=1 Tax=Paramecium sonneborni TaxID=65129 RepID=A0A8S1KMA5_9CILI|nr:unnamed protein product [Paramecium sonneborni]
MFKNDGDTMTNGQYIIDIKKEIGRGAYGVVYECRQQDSKVCLCAKIIKSLSSNSEYLNRESEILQTLSKAYPNNPNLVKVYYCQYQQMDKNDVLIVIMEKCQTNLKDQLAQKGTYSSEEVLQFLKQLLNGYKPLYEKCILHRDLKPENILISLDNTGQPLYKISDFGIGKINANNDFNITKVGTPVYAAPELNSFVDDEDVVSALRQLKDLKNGKSQVDVYSIGIILYQLLFGRVPFETQSANQLEQFLKNLKKTPFEIKNPTNQNSDLQQLIQKMIVYNPLERIKFSDIYSHKLINMQPEQPQKFQQFIKIKQEPNQSSNTNKFNNDQKKFQPQQGNLSFPHTQNFGQNPPQIQPQNINPILNFGQGFNNQPQTQTLIGQTPQNMRSTMAPACQQQIINNNYNNNQSSNLRLTCNQNPAQGQLRQTETGLKQQTINLQPQSLTSFPPQSIKMSTNASTASTASNASNASTVIQINQLQDQVNYLQTQLFENQSFYCLQTKKLLEQALESIKNNNNDTPSISKTLMEFYKMENNGQYSLGFLKFYYCLIRKAQNQQLEKTTFQNEQELRQVITDIYLKSYQNP